MSKKNRKSYWLRETRQPMKKSRSKSTKWKKMRTIDWSQSLTQWSRRKNRLRLQKNWLGRKKLKTEMICASSWLLNILTTIMIRQDKNSTKLNGTTRKLLNSSSSRQNKMPKKKKREKGKFCRLSKNVLIFQTLMMSKEDWLPATGIKMPVSVKSSRKKTTKLKRKVSKTWKSIKLCKNVKIFVTMMRLDRCLKLLIGTKTPSSTRERLRTSSSSAWSTALTPRKFFLYPSRKTRVSELQSLSS